MLIFQKMLEKCWIYSCPIIMDGSLNLLGYISSEIYNQFLQLSAKNKKKERKWFLKPFIRRNDAFTLETAKMGSFYFLKLLLPSFCFDSIPWTVKLRFFVYFLKGIVALKMQRCNRNNNWKKWKNKY